MGHITEKFYDDGIYSGGTYSGLYATSEQYIEQDNLRGIEKTKRIAKAFCWVEPYVHLEVDIKKTRLPKRCNAAWVCSMFSLKSDPGADGSHALVIWFDDYSLDVRESLTNVLEKIDWENVATSWNF